ncbi:MAG TPA: hypothetical protein VLW06_17000, partial [Terriglobales bacterium]|nr:hypothetical protein [Terriglobales bacterium]
MNSFENAYPTATIIPTRSTKEVEFQKAPPLHFQAAGEGPGDCAQPEDEAREENGFPAMIFDQ